MSLGIRCVVLLTGALVLAAGVQSAAGRDAARAGDGIPVRGPASGATFSTLSTIVIEIDEPWFCVDCDGTFALKVATDPGLSQPVFTRTGACPASTEPSCQLLDVLGPLPAGTYYWGLEVDFPGSPPHVSDVWSFTVIPPTPSTGPMTFPDATGDARGAPDISDVQVSTDGFDQLRFQIDIPGLRTLAADETVHLLIDADQRASTGSFRDLGAEYWFSFTGGDHSPSIYRFRRWDVAKAAWVSAVTPTTVAQYRNGVLLVLHLSDIGGARGGGLNFWAESDKGKGAANVYDRVPDASMANYQLPAGATSNRPSQQIATFVVYTRPDPPIAGRPLRVTVPVLILGTGAQATPQSTDCVASVAGRVLRGTGVGHCTFSIPPSAGGKVLRLTVDVGYGSAEKRRIATRRVHRR